MGSANTRRTGLDMEKICGLSVTFCKLDDELYDTKYSLDDLEAKILALKEVGGQLAQKIRDFKADNRELNSALSESKERAEFDHPSIENAESSVLLTEKRLELAFQTAKHTGSTTIGPVRINFTAQYDFFFLFFRTLSPNFLHIL